MITRFLWQGMGRNLRLLVLLVLAIGIVLPLLNQLMPPAARSTCRPGCCS